MAMYCYDNPINIGLLNYFRFIDDHCARKEKVKCQVIVSKNSL